MRVENNNKAFAYRNYRHFTQQCCIFLNSILFYFVSNIWDDISDNVLLYSSYDEHVQRLQRRKSSGRFLDGMFVCLIWDSCTQNPLES